MNKRIWLNVLKYLLAFGLLGYVIYEYWAPASGKGLQYVWQRHVVQGQPVNGGYLLGGSLVFLAALVLTTSWRLVRPRCILLGELGFSAARLVP